AFAEGWSSDRPKSPEVCLRSTATRLWRRHQHGAAGGCRYASAPLDSGVRRPPETRAAPAETLPGLSWSRLKNRGVGPLICYSLACTEYTLFPIKSIDEGYSGATLVRPALERLRDVIAARAVDRLYIHSPDRLARKYAYQVLLVDEFRRAGVEVIFLNRALGQSPEDDLLLQVQGMLAEYERAKILERHRR